MSRPAVSTSGRRRRFIILSVNWRIGGGAVIMVSSELPEILGMSDRVMVMHEGRITGILEKDEADQETILSLASH